MTVTEQVNISDITDKVEFLAWARSEPYRIETLKQDLKAALDEGMDYEEIAQQVSDEILNRIAILSESYPFQNNGYKIEAFNAERSTYIFCLGLSLLPSVAIQNEQRCFQFENVVRDAAQSFFGGDAIRIGAPWRDDETPSYAHLLDRVVSLIPNLGQLTRTAAPDGGDGGWDVLVAKNFADRLFPRFIALGNCATGRQDWKRKGMEVQPTYFWNFFAHKHLSTHVTFFAVPFVMSPEDRLRKLSDTNLVLDRFRICEHAPVCAPDTYAWVEAQRGHAEELPLG